MTKKPVTLLIVDDDPDDRELFFEAVKEINPLNKCLEATNGEEALALLRAKNVACPDLIFLDLNMPRMGGREFFNEMKKDKNFAHIPIVIYSTSKRTEDVGEMKRLGALTFITKPKTFEEICSVVSSVIQQNKLMTV